MNNDFPIMHSIAYLLKELAILLFVMATALIAILATVAALVCFREMIFVEYNQADLIPGIASAIVAIVAWILSFRLHKSSERESQEEQVHG